MKKISTKLTASMLCLTFAVLTFVGVALIFNMTLEYYRDFNVTVSALFESEQFANSCTDTDSLFKYITDNEAVLCRDSEKECYILENGNIVKSTKSGGLVHITDNLQRVLDGGVTVKSDITSDALDYAVHTGYGRVLYVRDTRADLYAGIADMSFLFLQAFVIGIVLTLLLSILISKRLTLSLKQLERGARKMQNGEFERVTVSSKDEVGRLCTVFNEMGEQIQADFDEFSRIENSRREFVANVSHELKTPLTVIKSYSQTLSGMDVDADTRKKFLAVIDSEVDRMTDIVGKLLKISRLESKSTILRERVDIRAAVTEILNALQIKAKEKSLEITVTGECCVVSDGEKIKTILSNLLTNAVKYSETGGKIQVTIGNNTVCVRDNGIGISESDLPRIFERFYRTDKARGRDTGGSGLGLAIAKECADSIGAKLSVKSQLHKYTEFELEIKNE